MLLYYKPSFILLCAILYIDVVHSLELKELQVPAKVPLGIRAVLLCRWALGTNDLLYSVKWYKDGKEFFRYVPRDIDPRRKFQLPGVDVQEFNSRGSHLTLAPAVLATSGRYRCEVSGERPHFHTVSQYADMLVLVLSSRGLSILGLGSHYRVGDYINASCVFRQTKSSVKLAWYVNGEVDLPKVGSGLQYVDEDGVISLSIEFTVGENLLGQLKLQCLATIDSIYWRSAEKSATVSAILDNKDNHILKDTVSSAHPKSAGVDLTDDRLLLSRVLCFCILFSIVNI